MARLRVGILISGRGSNMRALVEAARAPDFPAEIGLVVSNVPDAGGLVFARDAGIATATVDHRAFKGREPFEQALDAELRKAGVEFVCLAGFMRLLTPSFVDAWHDRMINIHPSLLPSFPGLDTHKRALAEGVRIAGCTVHFVRAKMDAGPIVGQAAVPVLPGDDEKMLAARILAAEHRLYPAALRLIAGGKTRVDGERVVVADAGAPVPLLLNPAV
ncbi:MAG: phosphoribosylglycinamide formyltransferase [Rhodospirillales bacterium]|nr:phosphoribosylglycinamide formyltransferase [Rhodospirillales bacterium]